MGNIFYRVGPTPDYIYDKYNRIIAESSYLRNIFSPRFGLYGLLLVKLSLFLITVLLGIRFSVQELTSNNNNLAEFENLYCSSMALFYVIFAVGFIAILIGYGTVDIGAKRIFYFISFIFMAFTLAVVNYIVVPMVVEDSFAVGYLLAGVAAIWLITESVARGMQEDFINAEVVHMIDIKEDYYIEILLANQRYGQRLNGE